MANIYLQPQFPLKLQKNKYALGEEIDLSSQFITNGITNAYAWKTASGITLIKNVDYTENNGKFTLIKNPGNYFYCQMTNTAFPNLTLYTENLTILSDEPAITITTNNSIGSSFSFATYGILDKDTLKVDWGNNTFVSCPITSNYTVVSGILTGKTIKVYGIGISYLNITSKNIATLVITENTALTVLWCNGNNLTTLDVTNNTALETLSCYNNNLTSLDVTKNIALKTLYCDNNNLTSLDMTKNSVLTTLDCYNNNMTSLDVTKNTVLTTLNCDNNNLTSLDMTKNSALKELYCSSNKLTTLDVTKNNALVSLLCGSNRLTFTSLPIRQSAWTYYIYRPQASIKIENKQYNLSETIDLSSQLTANGNTTTYIWKTIGETTLVAGTDYTITNGTTKFLKGQTDSVYCQMTNPTFPSLTLITTNIKVTGPTSVDSDLEQITKVYPNPLSTQLWVESEEMIKKVEIHTIVGTKVFEQEYNNTQKVNINATELPKGLLIVKVYKANGVMTKKILKE